MSKGLALWFACSTIVLLTALSITISHNGWLALLFGVLAFCNTGFGFAVKAKQRRRAEAQAQSQEQA
ncbi:hypothetical protein KIK04_06050 [Paenibacillus sp. 481]|nr:hypothetical protein [Paenibacillus sp. 481]UHA75878.1 hypothetical protein KIK04_06050 [Paenibacillus sp. 481]